MGHRAGHGVRAGPRSFQYRVQEGIHQVGVVTQATVHGVVAGVTIEGVVPVESIEGVVAGIASDGVGQGVTGADQGSAREDEVFDVGRKGVVNRTVDGVGACCGCLHDHIQGVVHRVDVVS